MNKYLIFGVLMLIAVSVSSAPADDSTTVDDATTTTTTTAAANAETLPVDDPANNDATKPSNDR